MKRKSWFFPAVLTSGLLLSLLLTVSARAASLTWTNLAGGNWNVAANWSPNQVPGAGDSVQITSAGTYNVTNNQNTSIDSLNVGGSLGTQNLFLGNGSFLTVVSVMAVYTSGSVTVLGGASFSPSAQFYIEGPVTNSGTLNMTNSSTALYNNGTTDLGGLVNRAGGQINLFGATSISTVVGPSDYFFNQGTVTKTATAGISSLSASRGVLQGTYNAASGSLLQLGGGTASVPLQVDGTFVLNGPGQFAFNSGFLIYPTNVFPGLMLSGGLLSIGPGFQGGAITNLVLGGTSLTNTLPVTGTLTATNGKMFGPIVIQNGATMSGSGVTFLAPVTVQNGGLLRTGGGALNFGDAIQPNLSLTIQSGGKLLVDNYMYSYAAVTNAGTITVTNGFSIASYNNGSPGYSGGIANLGGGVINLWQNATLSGGFYGSEFLINQGSINLMSGAGLTQLDFSSVSLGPGTITTQPGTGTLKIGTLNGLGSLAGTYNAAANSVIQFVAAAIPGTSAGAPLVLGGSGQYQFVQGLLTLPLNPIPGLQMTGGSVLLGPGFQGGSITNLALKGSSVSNNLPVAGTLVLTNSSLFGSIVISNGALVLLNGASLVAQVTIQGGGELLVQGSSGYIGNGVQSNLWLVVQSGGLVEQENSLNTYAPVTNSGTINITNGYALTLFNNNTAAYAGGIANLPSGIIKLWNNSSILGNSDGFEFLVNQGTINVMSGTGQSSILFYVLNLASGTITTQPGVGSLKVGIFNGLGNLTGTYNAASNSIIQFVASTDPGTSAGTPLVLGGTGTYQFSQGFLTLPLNPIPGLVMDGGYLALSPGFQGGAITNLQLDGIVLTNSLPLEGTLTLTGSPLYGSIVVSNGAVLNLSGSVVAAQVTVQGGGDIRLLAGGSGSFGDGLRTNTWLNVQSGGHVEVNNYFYTYEPVTNAGTINLTNGFPFNASNNGLSYAGSLVNLPGGIINLANGSSLQGQGFGNESFVNLGNVNVLNSSSESFVTFFILNVASGTMSTQPGTESLRVGTFNGPGSLTGTYSAGAGTVIEFASSANPGASAGTPFILGGPGRYQFSAGLLTLPLNLIPGLHLVGGVVQPGTGFQGGAITNLTVEGASLTNSLPLTGTMTMTNGSIYGSMVVSSGGSLVLNSVSMSAGVTVQSGGQLFSFLSSAVNSWLTVQSGGRFLVDSYLTLYGPLTNAGVINITNGFYITAINNGAPGDLGGIVNLPVGVIDLWNSSSLYGVNYGNEYLLNQGTINLMSGASTASLDFSYLTNSGVLGAYHATLQLQSPHMVLLPSATWVIGLSALTDYGQFAFVGNAPLSGALQVALQNGYVPALGSFFTVMTYPSVSSTLTGFNLPGVLPNVWQPSYSSTALTLGLVPSLVLQPPGTNALVGVNGSPGHQAILITSPNVALPRSTWTPVATNTFDATGYLGFVIPIDPSKAQQYYTFRLP